MENNRIENSKALATRLPTEKFYDLDHIRKEAGYAANSEFVRDLIINFLKNNKMNLQTNGNANGNADVMTKKDFEQYISNKEKAEYIGKLEKQLKEKEEETETLKSKINQKDAEIRTLTAELDGLKNEIIEKETALEQYQEAELEEDEKLEMLKKNPDVPEVEPLSDKEKALIKADLNCREFSQRQLAELLKCDPDKITDKRPIAGQLRPDFVIEQTTQFINFLSQKTVFVITGDYSKVADNEPDTKKYMDYFVELGLIPKSFLTGVLGFPLKLKSIFEYDGFQYKKIYGLNIYKISVIDQGTDADQPEEDKNNEEK
jgi:metal-responsive CopG/Arc/MetJ family transcriptional regulator